MKSKLFFLLSLALVFTLLVLLSGSIFPVDASFVGNEDLPNSSYTIYGKVTDMNGNDITGITITASRTVKIYLSLVLGENNGTSQVKKLF